jgi:stress response protein SCP2
VSDDEAILIKLDRLPKEVKTLILLTKIPNLEKTAPLFSNEILTYSRIGLQDF